MNFKEKFGESKSEPDFWNKKFEKVSLSLGDGFEEGADMRADKMLYQEQLDNNLEFQVCSNGPIVSFYIKGNEGDKISDFKYKKTGTYLEQIHREVSPELKQDYGIKGGDILERCENFLKGMNNRAEKENSAEQFLINGGQKGVVEWALKNGYDFKSSEEKEKYEKIKNGKEPGYTITDEFSYGHLYTGFIFTNENLEKAKYDYNQQLLQGVERKNIDLSEHTERFNLVKAIDTTS